MLLDLPHNIDDRFTLVAELGHGAHAIVYRALDRSLGREVAIKVLRAELVDSAVNERFRREIRLTSQLEHPHIAHVYDTGEFMGAPYFVTAIARGASLAERLERERQLPVDEALAIARQVASALEHAHKAGIVHRDVKPANILLTPDGALLTDFGVARALEAVPGTLATSTGVAVGTLLYMSPEQLCAEKGIDGRSDQYSLALVLYEMLAGVSAHVAANAEGLRALRIAAQHTPITRLRSSVPAHVEAAISRALCSAPADRFRTTRDFAIAMRPIAPGTKTSVKSWRRRMVQSLLAHGMRRTAVSWTVVSALAIAAGYGAVRMMRGETAMRRLDTSIEFDLIAIGAKNKSQLVAKALSDELSEWPDVVATLSVATPKRDATQLEVRLSDGVNGRQCIVTLRRALNKRMPERSVVMKFTSDSALNPDSLRVFAARILTALDVAPDSVLLPDIVRTRQTSAVHAYALGWAELLRGDLVNAEQYFAQAARTQSLPQAVLWRAIVASWHKPRAPASWRDAARAADEISPALPLRDSILAFALASRSSDRFVEACGAFLHAAKIDSQSFAAWYGLGDCLQGDSAIVLDRKSPTGVRFRTSFWSATRAFGESVERLPSGELLPLFDRLPRVAMAMNPSRRVGSLVDGTGRVFAGLPQVAGDTVVVYPRPEREVVSGDALVIPATYQAAIRLGRIRLLNIAAALARRAPTHVGAQLALARALEYAGVLRSRETEKSALSVLRDAARLARTSEDSIALGIAESRVRLRLGDFAGAGSVAGGLLRSTSAAPSETAARLAPLAFLVGRTALAESLVTRQYTVTQANADGVPESVASAIARYTLAAADGNCRNLSKLRVLANAALETHFAQSEMASGTEQFLSPGDWMRLTCVGAPLPVGASAADPLLRAVVLLGKGDALAAKAALRSMQAGRSGAASGAVAWDTRFTEIWLMLQSNDSSSARKAISLSLDELSTTMDHVLLDIRQVAGLRRSLETCATVSRPVVEPDLAGRCRKALNGLSEVR